MAVDLGLGYAVGSVLIPGNRGSAAMRRFQQRAAILSALTLGVAYFGGAVANAQEVIKIAAGAPLTGALAKQGQEVANAVKLAVEEWNKKGGVLGMKIEVLDADDQGNPQIGTAAGEKVAADARVMGAVWGITSVPAFRYQRSSSARIS